MDAAKKLQLFETAVRLLREFKNDVDASNGPYGEDGGLYDRSDKFLQSLEE